MTKDTEAHNLDPILRLFHLVSQDASGEVDVLAVGAELPSGKVVIEWITGRTLEMEIFSSLRELQSKHGRWEVLWLGDPSRGEPECVVMSAFELRRAEDVNGISGTGVVAMGFTLPSGKAVMQWITNGLFSVNFYEKREEVERIHGHEGRTQVRYITPPPNRFLS
jgi:hypothetical protein